MHGANLLADTVCARNVDYHKWDPAKQERYRKAAFDAGLRTLIFVAAYEGGGPVPMAFKVPSMEKEPAKFAKYRKAYTNMLFSWLGGSPQFTFKEADVTYRTFERIVVTPTGRRYLTVPVPNDPKHVETVAELVPKVSPEGIHYYEKKDIAKDERKILPADSVGPFGSTHKFRVGAYPVKFKYRIIPPSPIPIPVPVWPKAYAAKHHVMRDWVLKWDEAIVRIRPTKEVLFSQVVKDPYLRTMTVEIDTDVRTGDRTAFFHPPRHRFNETTGKEEKLPKYSDEGDYYSVGYAEADNDGKGTLYVYRRLDAEDRKEHPYPGDAREFYGMSDEKLKKKGVERVAIGRYDFGTGEISFKSEKLKGTLEKHFVGNWPLTKENMGTPLSKKEVEEAGISYHKGANYYRVTDVDLGSYEDTQALGPETRIRGPFNRERTDRTAILEPSTNIPSMYTPKRKR